MPDDTTPTPGAAYQHGRADERDGYSGEHSPSARVEPGKGEERATHATGSDAVGLSSPRLCPCGANVWGGKCVASGMTSAICGHVPLQDKPTYLSPERRREVMEACSSWVSTARQLNDHADVMDERCARHISSVEAMAERAELAEAERDELRISLDAETRRADDNDDARKMAIAERDELRAALTKVINAHHKCVEPSKLHDPEHTDFEDCPALTCRAARAALTNHQGVEG